MADIRIPSGALAVLDLNDLPEECVESLSAAGALVAVFHNPRTYHVRRTPDGLRLNARGLRAVLRRGLVLAACTLVATMALAYTDREVTVRTADPVLYTTDTGDVLTVRGARIVGVEHRAPAPAPSASIPASVTFASGS